MRRTATGQRPQLNQAHSSGWRWPRLLPIQEQHARASQDSQSLPRTSGAQSLHGEGEQISSPTEQGKTPATSNFQQEAEVEKTAPAPTSEEHSSETDNSMPSTSTGKNHPTSPTIAQGPMSGSVGSPSYARASSVKSPERKHSDAIQNDTSPIDEPAVASLEHRHTDNGHIDPSASGDPAVGSTDRRPPHQANDAISPKEDPSAPKDPDVGSIDRRPSRQANNDISPKDDSSAPRDPDVGSIDRRPSRQANNDISPKEESSAPRDPDVGSIDRRPSRQANNDISPKEESSASRDSNVGSTDRMPSHQANDRISPTEDSFAPRDPDVGSSDRRPSHQANDDVSQTEDSAAGSDGRMYPSGAKGSASTISGLNKQSSANWKDPDVSDTLTDGSISDISDETDQGPGPRRETASSQKEGEVGSPLGDEEPKATDRSKAKAADSKGEAAGEPTPAAPTTEAASVPSDPIPYYATPKIMVHKPSDSRQSDASGPRTIDEILAGERAGLAFEDQIPSREVPLPSADTTVLPTTVLPQLTRLPTGAVVQKALKVKKRSLYLRKARNLAARKTILKATLGRQLAIPTKQSLRQLANGETAVAEFPVASSILP